MKATNQSLPQKIGYTAEKLARDYLQKNGLHFITEHYHCRMGEIDLIMQDNTHLIFVEVRARSQTAYGSSSESITPSKQTKLLRAAHYYLQQHHLTEKVACRFDVIAIALNQHPPAIEWIQNAF